MSTQDTVNYIPGTDGDDTLFGTPGNDIINAGAGDDDVYDNYGSDTISTGFGEDRILITGADGSQFDLFNSYDGGSGYDQIVVTNDGPTDIRIDDLRNIEKIDGTAAESTTITLASGNTYDFSNVELDGITLIQVDQGINEGYEEKTRIFGSQGDDHIKGSAGDDVIKGSGGNDTLEGGTGEDKFSFYSPWGDDVITDFEDGEDMLDLAWSGLKFDDLTIRQEDANTVIYDGNGNSITLEDVQATSITQDDFFF
ncbi:hypothetical protein QGN29_10460 [Temperatibacter marinus]|uniref:Calcium-binding protein n=1 Tax=Temperatibacter marinus TaxID=1456591 RepID=A0AA52H9R8_9PROT|nr:hypothetical protein [Temperatibacter marinus]WND01970.1 hypothetical protein QGN29_10460 [Temperatibacter marinus]